MPVPAPPPCTRYQADGTRCRNTTTRTDRWCGRCDGFATAHPPSPPAVPSPAPSTPASRPSTVHGLEPEHAYVIRVSRNAVRRYSRTHRTDDRVSEAQIRTLLEDAIIAGASTSVDESGRLMISHQGYGLVLSPDRGLVVSYFTSHLERTWQQVRGGVRSRIPAARDRAAHAHRQAVIQRLPIRTTPQAFNLYARRVLNTRSDRTTFDAIGRALEKHLINHVLPQWMRSAEETIDDGTGWTWLLVRNERAPEGLVAACFATPDPQ